jgi:hypothetical protein
MKEHLPYYSKAGYKISFNLTGGFKSLQGYATALGMMYADELFYIFEGKDSRLVSIPCPRLELNPSIIKGHEAWLAMLDGEIMPATFQTGLPDLLIEKDSEIMLSIWGELLWNEHKETILSGELIHFPLLDYDDGFVKDYKKCNAKDRIQIQTCLARVSFLYRTGGMMSLSKDGGLQYKPYRGNPDFDHFRIDIHNRVTCQITSDKIRLIAYGSHDYTEGKVGVR